MIDSFLLQKTNFRGAVLTSKSKWERSLRISLVTIDSICLEVNMTHVFPLLIDVQGGWAYIKTAEVIDFAFEY